jgi:hypothetical protein
MYEGSFEMISGLGKCSISSCRNNAGVMFPLLAGSPAYCSHHAPMDTGPDDFDIPLWDEETPYFQEPVLTRRRFVWTDKEGNRHKLADIDDYYLNNIIDFLRHKNIEEAEETIRFLEKEAKRRKWKK